MKYFFYMIVCLALVGCTPATPTILHIQRMQQAHPAERGPVNDHGSTQLAGIHNHGSMQVYINSQAPGAPDPDQDPDMIPGPDNDIKKAEGLRLKPYTDPGKKLHIGYGRNLDDKGITKAEAEILFENDLTEARADLSENIFPGEWPDLPGPIKSVLINMRYQLGPGGFRGFGNMITAVRANDWQAMAEEMKVSLWAEQTPGRAGLLIRVVEAIGREG